jgi:ArsR family transcriptional regulator
MAFKRKPRKSVDAIESVSPPLKVSQETIEDLTSVFKLLADPSRLKIVLALAQHGKMHVTALCDMLEQSQPAVSHHLTLMRIVGLIKFDRTGKHNFYYLNSGFVSDLFEQFISEFGGGKQSLEFEDLSLTFSKQNEE